MLKFLLGFLVGSVATASYIKGQAAQGRMGSMGTSPLTIGHVDELSSAARNPVTPTTLNAGDGTPPQNSSITDEATEPTAIRH